MYVWNTQYGWTISHLTNSKSKVPLHAIHSFYADRREDAEKRMAQLREIWDTPRPEPLHSDD